MTKEDRKKKEKRQETKRYPENKQTTVVSRCPTESYNRDTKPKKKD